MSYFDLKVGFTCNNNCVHCVITDKKGTKDLTTQEIKETIDGVPKGDIVGFTGGEATIRADFLELLEYAKKTGHETALQTNGTQFSDWNFAVNVSKYLDSVLIAIHSHIPEVHNSIVRVYGMYEKTIEGFKNIIKLNILCSTQTVISKLNIDDLLETYDFIQNIKPGIEMSLTYPHPNGNAFTNADVVVPSFTEIADKLQSILQKHSKILRTEAIPMCYLYPYQDDVYNFDEHLIDDIRAGRDPANTQAKFFDEKGITKNYSESQLDEKRKGPRCVECVFNDRCMGVWKEYVTIHGKHFDLFPVTEAQYCDDDCECEDSQSDSLINKAWGSIIIYNDGSPRCMNSCNFCSGEHGHVDLETSFKTHISEADHFISQGIKQIEISGGDPGEYSRIIDLIKYLKQHDVTTIQFSTHGRTLKDSVFALALKEAGVTSIRIPLYGSSASIHNLTTQYGNILKIGDAFKDTIEGIKNCSTLGIPIVGYTLLNQHNKSDINNIIQLYVNLTDNGKNLMSLFVGVAFISRLDYEYTNTWYLPIKDMKLFIREIYLNHPPIPTNTNFSFLDIPYCVFEEYSDLVQNQFAGFPNLGLHKVEKLNRSEVSDGIPHYRIKSYFEECNNCDLADICGAVPLNEIKMFGTYGLKAIKENE